MAAHRPKRLISSVMAASPIGSVIVFFLGEQCLDVASFADLRDIHHEPLQKIHLNILCVAKWKDNKFYRCMIVHVDEGMAKCADWVLTVARKENDCN
jgi:hypothetical protein